MSAAPGPGADLDAWLDYIALVNPRSIELGLERVGKVWAAMGAGPIARQVITVAGSNGKGSCVASLERLAAASKLRHGSYTSPHIHRFNERIRLQGEEVADERLIAALAAIDAARGETLLSYFEFATLAALSLFRDAELDLAILEVGLGGRLDAVNIIDADVAVITSISLDHMDWLGSTREQIAGEKAGIMRPGKPVVCADSEVPAAIPALAEQLQAPLYLINREFSCVSAEAARSWRFRGVDSQGRGLERPLPALNLHPASIAASLQALLCLGMELPPLPEALGSLTVPGRCEWRQSRDGDRTLLFDVAHNPAAAGHLAQQLRGLRESGRIRGQIAVVLAVMADKDIEGIASSLQSEVDIWYIAQVDEPRCMPASEASQRVTAVLDRPVQAFDSAAKALDAALEATDSDDTVLVTGSFYTVAALRQNSRESGKQD
ncbi:MAG: bifunctional tetrahydrofolate synthase/dihydrofolate synthase [Pseudomonadales bacterium]|nr:bifunctional tetrahydrofolate synthase/dihydrofolate synthase [Pseudomonadales bacterium]